MRAVEDAARPDHKNVAFCSGLKRLMLLENEVSGGRLKYSSCV